MPSSIQLTDQQTKRLQQAAKNDFRTPLKMEDILGSLEKPRSYIDFSTATATHPETLLRIIKESATEGWLIELIDKMLESVPDDDLKSIRAELSPQAHAAGVDPFVACRLSGSNILVDRTDLRSHARSLVAMNGKRMLIVKGSRRSGKTHTAQFLAYLQQMHGGFSLLRIDLAAFNRVLGVAVQAVTASAPIQVTTVRPHGFTSGNQVFVDGVKGLIGANGLWTLTVTGPCEFILQNSSGAGVYTGGGLIKLQTPLEAWQLAETILELLPPQYQVKLPDPPTDAQWPRWNMAFCNRLEGVFQATPPTQPIWLVIDTFHAVSLSQSATDMIRELAQRINVNLSSLRLVLLGFEDSMPAEVSNHLAEEEIGPIGEDQIIEAVMAAFEQMQLEQNEQTMRGVLLAVLNEAALSDPEFLFKIGTAMTRELQKLESRV